MSTSVIMTQDEVENTPLTEEELLVIRNASERAKAGQAVYDPDCPPLTKAELAQFSPWYEAHDMAPREPIDWSKYETTRRLWDDPIAYINEMRDDERDDFYVERMR